MATKKPAESPKTGGSKKSTAAPAKSGAAKKSASRKPTEASSRPAKSQSVKPKASKPRSAKSKPVQSRMDTFVTVATTAFFALFALFVAYVLMHPQTAGPPPAPPAREKPVPLKIAKFEKPDFEIFPTEPILSRRAANMPPPGKETPPPKPAPLPPPSSSEPRADDHRPMVVIIIDDFGYDLEMAEKFLALDPALTCAILPHSVHDRKIAALARQQGHEIMLHQPMEPGEYPLVDPGPGALLSAMSPDERIAQLNANIERLPGICGINNHMGSKTTTMSDEMNQIFTVLKKRNLFFVDSRTTAASQALSSARLFKVPFAERDVFLDHVRKESQIRAQIDHLVRIAEVHGRALGIGHPYEMTYKVLKEALPEVRKRVRIVPASAMVEVF